MKAHRPGLKLIFELVPLLAGAIILVAAGIRWVGGDRSGLEPPILAVLTCLAFVALRAFGTAEGWNILLLGCLSILGGSLLGVMLSKAETQWIRVGGWALLAASAGGLSGIAARQILMRWARPLWVVAWIYVLGWLISMLGTLPDGWIPVWGAAGAAVFAGLIGVRLARWLDGMGRDTSGPAEAGSLLLLMANLFLAMAVLVG